MKNVSGKIKWIFAVGQMGWSILAGIIANLLVNFYLPDSTENGIITFVTSATFIGLTVIGLITACGRVVDAQRLNALFGLDFSSAPLFG